MIAIQLATAAQDSRTDWISVWLAGLTLLAAIGAGVFAGRAAHWTKQQAEATKDQVDAAKDQVRHAGEQVKLLEQELADAREAASEERADRKLEQRYVAETRLDAIAPTVLARAYPGGQGVNAPPFLEWAPDRGDRPGEMWSWGPVSSREEIASDRRVGLRHAVTVVFENISNHVARIDDFRVTSGAFEVQQGAPVFLLPGETRSLRWMGTLGSDWLPDDEQVGKHAFFELRFWVRDMSMGVRDEFRLIGDLRHFRRDGSRLVVTPELDLPWTVAFAEPTSSRKYERLDAASDRAAAAENSGV